MNQDIYNKLSDIIKPYLPEDVTVDQINEDSHLIQDLNINSTHLVDVVLDVEDAFDITIKDEEMNQMETVGQSVELINKKIEER